MHDFLHVFLNNDCILQVCFYTMHVYLHVFFCMFVWVLERMLDIFLIRMQKQSNPERLRQTRRFTQALTQTDSDSDLDSDSLRLLRKIKKQ